MSSTEVFLEYMAYRARVAKFGTRLAPFTFTQFCVFWRKETQRA